MRIFTNLTKAVVGVVASPVMLLADLLTLPSSACNDTPPFACTGKTLSAAGDCLTAAITPEKDSA